MRGKDERNRGRLREVLRKMDTPFEDGGGVLKISTLLGMYALGKAGGGLGSFVYNKVVNGMNHPLGEESVNRMDPSLPSSSSSATPPPRKVVANGPSDRSYVPKTRHPYAVSVQVL
jgi:hypothetical protein